MADLTITRELSKVIGRVRALKPEWQLEGQYMDSGRRTIDGTAYRVTEGSFSFTAPDGIRIRISSWTERHHGHISTSKDLCSIAVTQVDASGPITLFEHLCSQYESLKNGIMQLVTEAHDQVAARWERESKERDAKVEGLKNRFLDG